MHVATGAQRPFDAEQALRLARETFDIEAAALRALGQRVDSRFAQVVQQMLQTQGRVVVMGMGKSGHIGRKIAATLASTGTPACFSAASMRSVCCTGARRSSRPAASSTGTLMLAARLTGDTVSSVAGSPSHCCR